MPDIMTAWSSKTPTLFEKLLLVSFYELIFDVSPELESISVNPNGNFRIKKGVNNKSIWVLGASGGMDYATRAV